MKRTMSSTQTGSLPTPHFAILFEGAWLFTPDPTNPKRILATCPYENAPDHVCTFGTWHEGSIKPLGLPSGTSQMPEKATYRVEVQSDGASAPSFDSCFSAAADKYPFVYMPKPPGGSLQIDRDCSAMRQVSIPVPTSIRAAGAMVSAEVDGHGIADLYGSPVIVKRSFVTFLFIYEFRNDASVMFLGDNEWASIDPSSGMTHLLFRVHPLLPTKLAVSANDASAQMCHTIGTFDTLRGLVSKIENGEKQYFDIALYHGKGDCTFDLGDTGLGYDELGLPKTTGKGEGMLGLDLAACAGGGVGGDAGPPS